MDRYRRERIACQPGPALLPTAYHTAARTGRKFETETSLAGFAPFSKALFHWASLAVGNPLFQFGQQRHSTAAHREIALDLFVPGFPVAFTEPACQDRLLLCRELLNRLLDGFLGHTPNLARFRSLPQVSSAILETTARWLRFR